jgi:hypothetical protein
MLRIAFAAVLGLGLAAFSASPALAMADYTVVVHVPFAFSVDNVTLPAGDYTVHQVLHSDDPQLVEIQSTDGQHAAALAITVNHRPLPRGTHPDLLFDKYGNKEFLHAVRLPSVTGAVLMPSSSEVQAAREMATRREARASVK